MMNTLDLPNVFTFFLGCLVAFLIVKTFYNLARAFAKHGELNSKKPCWRSKELAYGRKAETADFCEILCYLSDDIIFFAVCFGFGPFSGCHCPFGLSSLCSLYNILCFDAST